MESSTMEYVSMKFINEFFEQEGLTLVTPSTPEHHTYNTEILQKLHVKRKMNEQIF